MEARINGASLVLSSTLIGLAISAAAAEPMSLSEVLAVAREEHPLIVAAREGRASAEGLFTDAGRWRNPTLTLSGENLRLGANDFEAARDGEWFVVFSQVIETADKRGHRKRSAAADIELAAQELRVVEREVLHQIKRSYANAFAAQEKLALSENSWGRLGELVELNRVRSAEGYVAEGDYIKSLLEAQRFELALRRAELEAKRAKITLLMSLGRSDFATDFALEPGTIEGDGPMEVDVPALRRAALERPEVLAAATRRDRAATKAQLENANAYPDVTAQAGYKRNGLQNTLYAGVVVPLPIYRRNEGQKRSARAELGMAEANLQLWQSRVRGELESALEAWRLTRRQVDSLRSDFIARADASREVALAAYREGAADLLVLLEAERTRNAAQELVVQALHENRLALHELERAASVDRLPRAPAGDSAEVTP